MLRLPRAALPVALLLVACATSGRSFDVKGVEEIEQGVTTERDVRDMFGSPIAIRTRGSGGGTWRYEFTEERTADTRTASRIGSFFTWLFTGRPMSSPVNVAYENEIRHQLVLFFDAGGVVEDFSYERVEKPSRRVY